MGTVACPNASSSRTSSCFSLGILFEKVRVASSYAVSVISSNLFYAIFGVLLAMVGATSGTMAGALIGLKTQSGFINGVLIGAINGAVFFVQLFKFSLLLWHFNHGHIRYFLSWFKSSIEKKKSQPIEKIPELRITAKDIFDTSEDTVSCLICLQDFQIGEKGLRLPHCRHIFHRQCIDKWLLLHKTCPLCRRKL